MNASENLSSLVPMLKKRKFKGHFELNIVCGNLKRGDINVRNLRFISEYHTHYAMSLTKLATHASREIQRTRYACISPALSFYLQKLETTRRQTQKYRVYAPSRSTSERLKREVYGVKLLCQQMYFLMLWKVRTVDFWQLLDVWIGDESQ